MWLQHAEVFKYDFNMQMFSNVIVACRCFQKWRSHAEVFKCDCLDTIFTLHYKIHYLLWIFWCGCIHFTQTTEKLVKFKTWIQVQCSTNRPYNGKEKITDNHASFFFNHFPFFLRSLRWLLILWFFICIFIISFFCEIILFLILTNFSINRPTCFFLMYLYHNTVSDIKGVKLCNMKEFYSYF